MTRHCHDAGCRDAPPSSHIQVSSLVIAIVIMLACTLYPPMMVSPMGSLTMRWRLHCSSP
jgi:hypothetical protein